MAGSYLKKAFFITLLVVYLAFMAFGALSDDITIPGGWDKFLHFVQFFILTVLLYLTFWAYGLESLKPLLTFLVCVIIAYGSEFVQIFTQTRSFSWLDFIVDIAGILSALFIAVVVEWILSRA
jgi:VanZ family protein